MGKAKHMGLPSGCLYGDILRSNCLAGLILTETAYTPALRLPKHAHEYAYFCFVLQGNFTEVYEGRSRAGRSLTLIYHPAGETHSDRFHTAARCFNVQMPPQWMGRVRQHARALDSPAEFHGGSVAHLAMRLYREFREIDDASPLAIEGMALEIIAEASRRAARVKERTPPRWLLQVREILHVQFSESLSLTGIAALVDVHPVYLASEFRRHYRSTIGEYVRRLRVEYACREITESDVPLAEVALSAGFSNQSHFSTVFKRLTGMTPAQYRTAARQS